MRDRMVIDNRCMAPVAAAMVMAGGYAGNIVDETQIHFSTVGIAASLLRRKTQIARVGVVDLIVSSPTGEISSLHLRFGNATEHFVFNCKKFLTEK